MREILPSVVGELSGEDGIGERVCVWKPPGRSTEWSGVGNAGLIPRVKVDPGGGDGVILRHSLKRVYRSPDAVGGWELFAAEASNVGVSIRPLVFICK